jgi:hypothetical protein
MPSTVQVPMAGEQDLDLRPLPAGVAGDLGRERTDAERLEDNLTPVLSPAASRSRPPAGA